MKLQSVSFSRVMHAWNKMLICPYLIPVDNLILFPDLSLPLLYKKNGVPPTYQIKQALFITKEGPVPNILVSYPQWQTLNVQEALSGNPGDLNSRNLIIWGYSSSADWFHLELEAYLAQVLSNFPPSTRHCCVLAMIKLPSTRIWNSIQEQWLLNKTGWLL